MIINFFAILLARIANQKHIVAARRGLMLNLPFTLAGCLSIMLANIPIPRLHEITLFYGHPWQVIWQAIANASLNIMSILLVMSTSYFLAERHLRVKDGTVHPLITALVSLVCLMVIIQPFTQGQSAGLSFEWIGVGGILVAIMTAFAATGLFLGLCSVIHTNTRLYSDTSDPVMSQALACILPAAATVFIFILFKMGAAEIAIDDIHRHVSAQIELLLAGCSHKLGKVVVFNLLVHFLWFFGLHGNNIMEPALMHIDFNAGYEAAMIVSHAAGDKAGVLTKTFQDVFILMGGSGTTAGLLLALLLFAPRRGNLTGLMRLSIIPALFNINEILIFGLPIVLNPVYLIPFILVPVISAVVSYMSISLGFVSVVAHGVHWTTPPLLSGYLATDSWSGVMLQLTNLLIGTAVYLPFVIISEKHREAEIQQAFDDYLAELKMCKPSAAGPLLARHDRVGALARILAHDLKLALRNHHLYLAYQPQVAQNKRVIGVEALLRWRHHNFGPVPPSLIVAVAEESGFIQEIGKWVITTASRQLSQWKSMGVNIRMSVNVSVLQLQQGDLSDDLIAIITANGVEPQEMEIEITEEIALENDAKTNHALERLRALGVRIAIDDFGAGRTSLRYIKHFPVDTLKIDHVLSRDVAQARNCQEIIASLVSLCSSLHIDTIVEYVETRAQLDKLIELGCTQFQGFYFSPPLLPEKATAYILQNNNTADEAAAGIDRQSPQN